MFLGHRTEQRRQIFDKSWPGDWIEFMTSYWQLNTLYRGSTLNFSTNSLPDIKKADFGWPKNDFTSQLIILYDLQTLMNKFPCSAGKCLSATLPKELNMCHTQALRQNIMRK